MTKTHKASEVWDWFYSTILCRYGVPYVVRSDQGLEYKGEFKSSCTEWGIMKREASTQYPQANGQAERFVGLIKLALVKFCGALEVGSPW